MQEHFAKECTVPHQLYHRVGRDCCSVLKNHFHYHLVELPTCPYVGFHSAAFYKQVERSGIDDGEVVNNQAT